MATAEELNQQLLEAAVAGDIATINRLLAAGADVNLADKNARTTLFCAANNSNTEETHLLLEAGANPNATDEDGNTVLKCAAKRNGIKKILKVHSARIAFRLHTQPFSSAMTGAVA